MFLHVFGCVLGASTQNHVESRGNYVKKSVWEPKCGKLNEKSELGHVRHVPKAPSEGETLQKKHPLFFFKTTKSISEDQKLQVRAKPSRKKAYILICTFELINYF